MKSVKSKIAFALVLAAVPLVSMAQEAAPAEEAESPISWELAVVSDYVFRGVSQSDENPTAQATVTYTSPIGVYAGVWASGVDFGSNKPDFEVDYYVGYGFDISDAVAFDVLLNRYSYPGASELNFNELITNTTFADTYTLTVAYTNDVYNSGEDGWYYAGAAEWGFGNDYTFGLNVGRSTFEDGATEDYTDWGVAVGKSWGMVSAKLGYVGTDGSGRDNFGELADNRLVLTLSVGQ